MSKQYSGNRIVVLDTETTGLDPKNGHRLIEVGCVEMRERRLTGNNFHIYLQPDREIDAGALEVHGISNAFLADKPRFAEKAAELLEYLRGAELIIHNAAFDVGFLEHEFGLCGMSLKLSNECVITDTLKLARKLYPGQRNSLDALCKRLGVNNAHRTLHGALLDSEILADVYLTMTGGQTALLLDVEEEYAKGGDRVTTSALDANGLIVVQASRVELEAHATWLDRLEKESESGCIWRKQ